MKVDENGCWIWQRATTRKGYGKFGDKNGTYSAHRESYKTFCNANLLPQLDVLHRCDVKACINPDHLYEGTNADNLRDRKRSPLENRGDI